MKQEKSSKHSEERGKELSAPQDGRSKASVNQNPENDTIRSKCTDRVQVLAANGSALN